MDEWRGSDDQQPQEWTPPTHYAPGPIPGVPDDVLACMPKSGMIHAYVWWAQQTTYANPIYHLGAILPCLAYDLAMRGFEVPFRGRQVALQSFLIGHPATAKSTCLRTARAFHESWLEAVGASLIGESWDRLKHSPWIQAEGTVPGLLEVLHDTYKPELGISPALLFHEEADAMLRMEGVTSILMQLFDALPFVERQLRQYRDMRRKGQQPPNRVEMPAVGGVIAGTNDGIARVIGSSHFEGGLVSRSLWLSGEPDRRKFTKVRSQPRARQFVLDGWIHFAHHHTALTVGVDAAGELRMICIPEKVNAAFTELLESFFHALDRRDIRSSAILQRAYGQAQLVAALYAWSRGELVVSREDAEAAAKLIRWSIRTTGVISQETADDLLYRKAQKALEVIEAAGPSGLPRADLYRALQASKAVLDATIAQLIDAGDVREFKMPSGGRGRPPIIVKATKYLRDEQPSGVVIKLPSKEDREGIIADSHEEQEP